MKKITDFNEAVLALRMEGLLPPRKAYKKETIKINISTTEYKKKPTSQETGSIQKEIKNNTEDLTVENLANALVKGRSFKPGLLNGTKSKDWIEQQVFCIDIDNGLTIKETLKRCIDIGIRPAFIYPTFSHTEEKQKFRIVFVNEQPIKDIRVRNAVQISLMTIFPEADKSCKDPARLFHGSNKDIAYKAFNDRIDPYCTVQSMIAFLKETKKKNFNRYIENYCKTVGINKINNMPDIRLLFNSEKMKEKPSTLYYIYKSYGQNFKITFNFNIDINKSYKITEAGEGKKNFKKSDIESIKEKYNNDTIQHFDFEQLENRCELYSNFINNNRWCYHGEVFGMSTNLWRVEGAEKRIIETIQNNDCYKDKINKINTIKSCRYYGYAPMNCNDFCPYANTCEHNKNMLQQLELKRQNIRQVKNIKVKAIGEAEKELEAAIKKAYESKDNDIYVIKAPAGLGKTTALSKLKDYNNLCIAYPNHRLGQDIIQRLQVPNYLHLKEISLSNKTIQEKYQESISKGNFKKAYAILDKYKNKLLIDTINDPETREKIQGEIQEIENFEYKNKISKDFTGTIFCTHKKVLNLKNKNIKTYIIDEDIVLSSLVQIINIDIQQLEFLKEISTKENFKTTAGIFIELIEKSRESIVKPNQVVKINSKMYNINELKSIIAKYGDNINCNIIDLNKIQYITTNDNGSIQGIVKNELPNKKIIILSASVSEKIYTKIFKDRNIKFVDLGNVENQGKLILHYGTFSRTKLSDLKKFESTIEQIKKESPGIKNLITYAKYESKFKKEKFNTIAHFGACQGLDKYKGQDLIVLGTPHIDNRTYILIAAILGEEFSISNNIEYCQVERNGFQFYFNAYEGNTTLQEIQLYLIESEILQAVGRARILRTNSTVHLYSSLPLIGSEIF